MLRKLPQTLERLEDRAMLSASYGSMPHGNGGHNPGPHGGSGGPHFAGPASFASQQSRSGHDLQNFQVTRDLGRGPGVVQDRTVMHDVVAPRYAVAPTDWGRVAQPTWNQQVVPPPPQIRAATQQPKPMPSSMLDSYAPGPPQIRAVTQRYEPPFIQEFIIIRTTIWTPPTIPYPSNYVDPLITRAVKQNPAPRLPAPALIDSTANAIPSAAEVLAFRSPAADLPTVSQIITRDTNSVAMLSTAAHDLAIQDFAPRLFQSTSATSYDRLNFASGRTEVAQAEALDGFIQPYNELVVEKIVDVADAVAREREAVDAVLRELRDVNSPLSQSESPGSESPDGQASNAEIDLQTEITATELPAGEVEGGMVLLQSTGDANESGFDLGPVYAAQVEHFDSDAGMETSVGLIQAVDVVFDDSPSVDNGDTTDSIIEPQADVPIGDTLPAREQTSSRKAAALVGVTTLTGALMWISRNSGPRLNPLSVTQKRRANRS